MSIGNLGEAILVLRTDQGQFDRELDNAKTKAEGFGKSASQSITDFGNSVASTGQTLTTRMTLPIVGAGIAILKTAGDFEMGMNRVQAISGATGDEFKALEDQAKKLGAETQFSASEAADAMGFLAMAGFDANEILGAMPGTLQLAASANMDLGTTADIVSNILQGYGKDVEELAHVNDVLVKAMTGSNVDLQMLGESMKYAAPVASAVGIEFEEAAAAIGLMGNAGIQGSMAGTSLRGAITRLINPSAQAKDAMDALGLTATDAEGNFLPLVDIVRQLEESGADASDMMLIFGQRAGPAMQALVDQGADALANFTAELEDSEGTAERVAAVQMQGLNGMIRELTSALEGLVIAIAQSGLLDFMTEVIRRAAGFIMALVETDSKLLRLATIIVGVAAAIGPLLMIVGKAIAIFGAFVSPLGLVALAITAFGLAIKENLFGLGDIFQSVADAVGTLIEAFQMGMRGDLKGILELFGGAGSVMQPLLTLFFQLGGAVTLLSKAFKEGGLTGVFQTLRDLLPSIAGNLLNVASAIGGALLDALSGVDWGALAGSLADALLGALGALADVGGRLLEWLSGAFGGVDWSGLASTITGGGLLEGLGALADFGGRLLEWITSAFSSVDWSGLAGTLVEGLLAGLSAAGDFGMQLVDWISGALADVDWSGLASTITGGITAGLSAVQDFGTSIIGWLSGQLTSADWSRFSSAFSSGVSKATEAIDAAGSLGPVQTLVGLISDKLGPAFETLAGILGPRVAPVIENLRSAFSEIASTISSEAGPTLDQLKSTFAALQPILVTVATVIGSVLFIALNTLANVLSAVLPPAISAVMSIIQGFLRLVELIADTVTNVVRVIVNLIQGDFSGAWEAAKDLVTDLVDGIIDVLGHLVDAVFSIIGGLVDGVIAFFQGLWYSIVGGSIIPDMVNGIIEWISKLPGELIGLISGLATSIIGFFLDLQAEVLAKVAEVVTGVIGKFGELVAQAPGVISEFVFSVLGFFSDLVTEAIAKAVEIVTGVIETLGNLALDAPGKIADFGTALATAFGTVISNAYEWGKAIVHGVINGVEALWDTAVGTVSDLGGALIDAGKGMLGISSPSKVFAEMGENVGQGLVLGMEAMLGPIIAIAERYGEEVTKGVERVAGATSSAISLFKDLLNVSNQAADFTASGGALPAETFITKLVSFTAFILDELSSAVDAFGEEFLEAARAYSETAAKGVGLIAGAAEALATLASISVDLERARSAATAIKELVQHIVLSVGDTARHVAAERDGAFGVEADQFAQRSISGMELIGAAAEALVKLADVVLDVGRAKDAASALKDVIEHVVLSIGDTAALVASERPEGFVGAGDVLAQGAQSALSAIMGALEYITKLADFEGRFNLQGAKQFATRLKFLLEHIVLSIGDSAAYISTLRPADFLVSIQTFAEALEAALGVLVGALDFATKAGEIEQLSTAQARRVADALLTLARRLAEAVSAAAATWSAEVGPRLAAFRADVDASMGVLGTTAESATKLAGVSDETLEADFGSLSERLVRIAQVVALAVQSMAQAWAEEADPQISAFAADATASMEIMSRVGDTIKALLMFGSLEDEHRSDYRKLADEMVKVIAYIVRQVEGLAYQFRTAGLAAIGEFADSAGKGLDLIQRAADAFEAIDRVSGLTLRSTERFTTNFKTVLDLIRELNRIGQEYLSDALSFQQLMEAVAGAMLAAAEAIDTAAGTVGQAASGAASSAASSGGGGSGGGSSGGGASGSTSAFDSSGNPAPSVDRSHRYLGTVTITKGSSNWERRIENALKTGYRVKLMEEVWDDEKGRWVKRPVEMLYPDRRRVEYLGMMRTRQQRLDELEAQGKYHPPGRFRGRGFSAGGVTTDDVPNATVHAGEGVIPLRGQGARLVATALVRAMKLYQMGIPTLGGIMPHLKMASLSVPKLGAGTSAILAAAEEGLGGASGGRPVHVTVNAPDTRPSTISNAVELASIRLANELDLEGLE